MWLACDEKSKRFVTVKVCTEDLKPQEIGILSDFTGLQYSSNKTSGKTLIPSIMDKFGIQGLYGDHDCYVVILSRASFTGAKDGS